MGEDTKNDKKSNKIKVWSIIFLIICLLFTMLSFRNGQVWRGLVGVVQIVMFGYSLLLCLEVVPEKVKNLHRILFIIGLIMVVPFIMVSGDGFITSDNYEKIHWDSIVMHNQLPTPKKLSGKIMTNSDKELDITIKDDKDGYSSYVDECITKGYTIDSEKDSSSYEAYNNEGYHLELSKYSDNYSITLNAPMQMSENAWPNNELANMLPKPESTTGKVFSDSSNQLIYYVGSMNDDAYNKYIEQVKEKGFDKDYNSLEKSYSAENDEGYEVRISKEGFNIVEISITKPSKQNASTNITSSTTTTESSTNTESSKEESKTTNSTGIRPDFKNAMDSYEKFMNQYCDFMIKYNKNPSDITLIKDYAKMVSDYDKYTKDFENWKSEDLNDEEMKYYLDVQNRVSKKLVDATK